MISKIKLFIQIYCIISSSVAIFLNPQQTKYFGGLAIELKQAGLFSRYKTAEFFVYIISWLLIGTFFQLSFSLAVLLF
jgi:preprotein translocase subunit SecG